MMVGFHYNHEILILEPLSLYGEGNYALTDVKDVDVTDAFLGLNHRIKLCQNEETYQECMKKEYIKKGLELCGCTPFKLRDYTKKVIQESTSICNILAPEQ